MDAWMQEAARFGATSARQFAHCAKSTARDLADPLPVREPRLPQVHGLPVDVNGMLPRLKAPVYAVCREVVVK